MAISTLDKNVSTQQLKLHSTEVTVESFNLIAEIGLWRAPTSVPVITQGATGRSSQLATSPQLRGSPPFSSCFSSYLGSHVAAAVVLDQARKKEQFTTDEDSYNTSYLRGEWSIKSTSIF